MILSAIAVLQLGRAMAALDARTVELTTVPQTNRPVAVISRGADDYGRTKRLVLSDADDWQLQGGNPLNDEAEHVMRAQYP